jgi:hypothetical protein
VKTLKEFLAERAEIERGRADEKRAIQQEWRESLHRLVELIGVWLRDSDPEHLLEVEERFHELREADVGVYTAPGLAIRLEDREVRLVPIARKVVGPLLSGDTISMARALGRVDLTDGAEKFMIFRTRRDPDEWMIVEDRGYVAKRFDRPAFEEALQSLLG